MLEAGRLWRGQFGAQLRKTGLGKEGFALRDVVPRLREKVEALRYDVPATAWAGEWTCPCCCRPTAPGLKEVTMDIDQAFEASVG